MIDAKTWCAALLGVSLGGGAVHTAHTVKSKRPAAVRSVKHVARPARPAPANPIVFDCPPAPWSDAMSGPVGSLSQSSSLSAGAGVYALSPGVGGGWSHRSPVVTPPTSPIPEPGAWAMLVAGFGLVGLSMRRGK